MASKTYQSAKLTVVQGVADGFVQGSLDTQISTESNAVWLIHRLEFMLEPSAVANWGIADTYATASVTDEAKTSVVPVSDDDWLEGFALANPTHPGATSANWPVCAYMRRDLPGDGLLVAAPAMYMQFKTHGTSVINTLHLKLWYEPVRVSEIDLLRLRTL